MPTIGAKFLCWWVALVWVCDLVEYTIELKSTNLKATFNMELGIPQNSNFLIWANYSGTPL